jgi:hypothetical protein
MARAPFQYYRNFRVISLDEVEVAQWDGPDGPRRVNTGKLKFTEISPDEAEVAQLDGPDGPRRVTAGKLKFTEISQGPQKKLRSVGLELDTLKLEDVSFTRGAKPTCEKPP